MENILTENFWHQIHSLCLPSLLYHSRIHPIKSFHTPHCQVYVKREDESSFGISGYKKRKYASLIPFIQRQGFEQVFVIGSIYSNHLVGISQLLRENRISFRALLKKPHEIELKGNAYISNLLLEPHQIIWIPKEEWPNVEYHANKWAKESKTATYVIPEGGTCAPSLPGMCTLWQDIETNETQQRIDFDHIFVDAGTGLAAATLALINHILPRKTTLHILLVADTEAAFTQRLHQVALWMSDLWSQDLNFPISDFKMYLPYTGASFGSVNRQVFETIQTLAAVEGLLVDPVYSAKLFMNARHIIHSNQLSGNALIIHSGGGIGLMGFAHRFSSKFPVEG